MNRFALIQFKGSEKLPQSVGEGDAEKQGGCDTIFTVRGGEQVAFAQVDLHAVGKEDIQM